MRAAEAALEWVGVVAIAGAAVICALAILVAIATDAMAARVDCVSSVTGKYVSRNYANLHRGTTVCKDRAYRRKYEYRR